MHALRTIMVAAIAAGCAFPVGAQSLERRIAGAAPGRPVVFEYEARPGVCGDGDNIINVGDEAPQYIDLSDGRRALVTGRGRSVLRSGRCDFGPVRVELTRDGPAIERLQVRVGADELPAGAAALGTIPAPEAVDYLIGVARDARTTRKAADNAIFAVTLARDVEPWPDLLDLARAGTVRRATRKTAVFWVGQAAAARATEGLKSVASDESADIEVRESAIFALSQRPADEGVPVLIEIAKTAREPELRRSALFWLGQSDDPRVLALFEEILLRSN